MTTPPPTSADLKRTPFASFHRSRGAKLVEFAGWEMPLHYGSILQEHRQVRSSGGLFDVSHMGRLAFTGRDAQVFLDRVCTRQIAGMKDGQVRYSLVCNERGGCRDDVLVYRVAEGDYMMVCNAVNREKLLGHFADAKGDLVFRLEDLTEVSGMVAVQGPAVMDVIARHSNEIPQLKRYRFVTKKVLGLETLVSRTGYTGEDGVELIVRTDGMFAKSALGMLVTYLTELEGTIEPAGLGARDSLRLEAGMALYGHEIDEDIDPLAAGLGFAVTLEKGEDDAGAGPFIGQEALRRIADKGPRRRLVGLVLDSPRAARPQMPVREDDAPVGVVTSGCLSPTLDQSIAMAYLDADRAEPGRRVTVDLGRQAADAEVVVLPFYRRGRPTSECRPEKP